MDGYFLLTWALINSEEGYDMTWLWENVGSGNVVEDPDDQGYWIMNFPDTDPMDGKPDFIQTGAGGGITMSQKPIQG